MAQDNRTERPTAKRLNKAYEKGNLARSADVGQSIALAVFLLWSGLAGASFVNGLRAIVRDGITAIARPEDVGRLTDDGLARFGEGLTVMLPLLLLLMVAAIAGSLVQTGWHPRKGLVPFEFNRLNPIPGLKRFFSLDKLIGAGKALLRTLLYAIVAALVVLPEWSHVTGMAALTPAAIWDDTAGIARRILMRALLVGIVVAVADFAITRYRWYHSMYMTKQEIRDEHKENENPEIKGRIRGKQREIARRRMMASVQTADVVVTNPTHVAVALKYDRIKMAAPVVVAKGKGYIALRIREEAGRHGVPIVEDPPLARMLEKLCPIGGAIPETLYRAVAEVLAYVFRKRRGTYRTHEELETAPAGNEADR